MPKVSFCCLFLSKFRHLSCCRRAALAATTAGRLDRRWAMCRRRCHTPQGTSGQSTRRRSSTLMPAGLAVQTWGNAPTSLRWAAVTY